MKLKITPITFEDLKKIKITHPAPHPDFWRSNINKVIWLSREVKSSSCSIERFEQPREKGKLQIVCELNYDGHQDKIVERSSTRREIEEEIERLSKELKKKNNDDWKLSRQIEKLKDLLKQNSDKQPDDEIKFEVPYSRLGYYIRENNTRKIVMLMRNCIRKDQGQDQPNPQTEEDAWRFLSTYIHELFHAYFDSNLQESSNHIPFIEEPIVEYSMLKSIEEFQKHIPYFQTIDLLKYAEEAVEKKQYNHAISHYGFGYFLWKWEKDGNAPLCDWIDLFRKVKYDIGNSPARDQYEGVFKRGFYPFEHEEYFMNLLHQILINAQGGTVVSSSLPSLQWENIGPKAFAAIDNNVLYLDGAFFSQYKRKIDRHLRKRGMIIKEIVLWEHYVCDTFKRLGNYAKLITSVDSKNYYYKMGIAGNVVDK